jgi:hypothetical protein
MVDDHSRHLFRVSEDLARRSDAAIERLRVLAATLRGQVERADERKSQGGDSAATAAGLPRGEDEPAD